MLICILTKNVITSCSVTMMLFLHLEVKPLMKLTTVLYLSCALISGHMAMMLMELNKRRYASFLVVFFFNDTATTEIYTLSLHDALPIWLSGHRLSGSRPCPKPPSAFWKPDRKSTRLNSSHGSISYAVFCLKKKKKV